MRLLKEYVLAALVILCVQPLHGQTTYDSVFTSVNLGNPSMVTYQFGHKVDGTPGTTELIIQCGFGRAELILNFDVYGLQSGSDFFYPSCHANGPRSYNLSGLPETFHLTMHNFDGTTTPLTLTIKGAFWGVSPCPGSRWGCGFGLAEIAY